MSSKLPTTGVWLLLHENKSHFHWEHWNTLDIKDTRVMILLLFYRHFDVLFLG